MTTGRPPMTDAGWTRETPKVAGWYWHKSGTVITLVRLILRGGVLLLWVPDNEPRSAAATFAPYPGTEWLGPISPDTYHQGRVAGLKCVRRKITDIGERAFTDYEEDMDVLTEWLDFQLEQQAHGGEAK